MVSVLQIVENIVPDNILHMVSVLLVDTVDAIKMY